jgi:hypothetical protein
MILGVGGYIADERAIFLVGLVLGILVESPEGCVDI